ncbi:MAG: AAA family ATPase [Candidatus Humimicrobiaceae bacterium]
MFIGRKAELEFLTSSYNSKSAQLIVLYGRRRVGKTETLHEFCKDKPHVFYSCRECTDEEQLKSFSQRMLKPNIYASKYISKFMDWDQAFRSVIELPGDGKKLLIIDEFPYLVKNNDTIPSLLQNLWDESLKNENIMIILCGSAMGFIEKKFLQRKIRFMVGQQGYLK